MLSNPCKSELVRNVVKILTGSVCAQLLAICATPILARIYSPIEFGHLGLFIAITTPLIIMADLKYSMAAVIPEDDVEAKAVLGTAAVWVAIVSMLTLLLGVIAISVIRLTGIQMIVLALAIFATPIGAWLNIITNHNTRNKQFREITIARITRAVVTHWGAAALGAFTHSGMNLILTNILGQATSNFIQNRNVAGEKLHYFGLVKKSLTEKTFGKISKKYRGFPLFRMPHMLISAFSTNLLGIFLAAYYNAAAIGHYWFAYQLVKAPGMLMREALGSVLYQKSAELYRRNGNVRQLFIRGTLSLSVLSIFPIALLLLYGADLFSLFFGEQWRLSGEIAGVLAVWLFSSVAASLAISLLNVMEGQHILFLGEIISSLLKYGLLMLFSQKIDLIESIKYFSIIGFLLNIFFIGYVYCKVKSLIGDSQTT